VQILEHEHEWTSCGDCLEEPTPGRERLGSTVAAQLVRRREAGKWREVLGDPERLARLGDDVLDGDSKLGLDRRGRVGSQDARLRFDGFGESPEGDPVSVGEGAALAPEDHLRPAINVLEELPDQAGLADSGRTNERDEPWLAAEHNLVEHVDEHLELARPADERAGVPEAVCADSPTGGDHLPDGNRGGLSLRAKLRPGPKVDLKARAAIRALVDENPVDRRGRLNPRSGVDNIAVCHCGAVLRADVERDDRFSGCDPDADLELGRAFVAEARDRLAHRVGGANRALRVVLVRGRSAEKRHCRIADEFLDRAAVAFELSPDAGVVRIHDPSHVLGVELLRELREPDDVDENDTDDLPFERGLGPLELSTA
jgi:hypothetical protein